MKIVKKLVSKIKGSPKKASKPISKAKTSPAKKSSQKSPSKSKGKYTKTITMYKEQPDYFQMNEKYEKL